MTKIDAGLWLTQFAKVRILGKSPMNVYLRLNRRLWPNLPAFVTNLGPIRSYGNLLHALVRLQSVRSQLLHTFFLRNRSTLELLRRLVVCIEQNQKLNVAVLGCSTGAEAYSVAWRIRSARPDLQLTLQAVDISQHAIEIAKCGVYSHEVSQITGSDVFDGIGQREIEELFDRDRDVFKVKAWIKDGIEWHVRDAGCPETLEMLGPQHIVIANNFLCHMDAEAAERSLRSIGRLVSPHGYLFVSGIDLDIRTKVALDLGWKPLRELLEEIHEGDPRMARGWPWNYSSLEPLNKTRPDWRLRYATAFQLAARSDTPETRNAIPSPRSH
jgi:chemotaxis methyl-accepting protein methylase